MDKARFTDEAKIVVSTKRTFEAAAGYAGQKVAVHNFASATNPGGGVTRGLILSRLVDTFSSRILYPMLLLSGKHSISAA